MISILPEKNPTTSVAPAAHMPSGLRYIAKVIDLVIVFGPAYLAARFDEDAAVLMAVFGWLIYNWFMVAIYGATVGKLIIRAVVVDKNDSRCGSWRSFCRALLEYTYLMPLVWLLSVILLPFDKEARTPLDRTSGTRVVRRSAVRHLFATDHANAPRGGDFEYQLRKLSRLRDEGVITAADFERKKKDILGLQS